MGGGGVLGLAGRGPRMQIGCPTTTRRRPSPSSCATDNATRAEHGSIPGTTCASATPRVSSARCTICPHHPNPIILSSPPLLGEKGSVKNVL